VVGTGEYVEIWDRQRWDQHLAQTEDEFAVMSEGSPELFF